MKQKKSYSFFSDQDLFSCIKERDADAFANLYQRYWPLLYIQALKLLKEEEQAKDVVQELFSALWEKAPKLDIKISVSSYLYSAIRNKIFNLIEHNKIEKKYGDSINAFVEAGAYITDEKVRENEMRRLIEHEINLLPEKMREIFLLSRKEFLSHKEIGNKLGLSDKTVKTQVNNALKILRSKLKIVPILLLFLPLK